MFRILWDYLGVARFTLRLIGIVWDCLRFRFVAGLLGFVWEILRVVWDCLGLLGFVWNREGLPGIALDYLALSWIAWVFKGCLGFSESFGIVRDCL